MQSHCVMNRLFCCLMNLAVVNIVEDLDDLPFCLVSRMRSLDVDLPTTTLLLFRADPSAPTKTILYSHTRCSGRSDPLNKKLPVQNSLSNMVDDQSSFWFLTCTFDVYGLGNWLVRGRWLGRNSQGTWLFLGIKPFISYTGHNRP